MTVRGDPIVPYAMRLMTFGLGMIGCGGIGNVHAQTARRAGIKIMGAWDILPDRAALLIEQHGAKGSEAVPSIDALLAMKGIDKMSLLPGRRRNKQQMLTV
mgnify:CR=1 FL=1